MEKFGMLNRRGLKLDAPQVGDIVTVRVKPKPVREKGYSSGSLMTSVFGDRDDEAYSPQHYRMTTLFRVIAVNGGSAVVERIDGYSAGLREVWPISLHEWFEASDLHEAMKPREKMTAADIGANILPTP